MDSGTELAIRAIIRGLFQSDAINRHQVQAIMSALKEAAGGAQEGRDAETAKELAALCKHIHLDTGVPPSSD
ncbi:hypothetical protein [Sphingobium aromaticivastans]|uniref:hypothetical protein n=1 Tax=Sphingobium aromaticivastans TaxID=1778665 RepID=UPI0030194B4D